MDPYGGCHEDLYQDSDYMEKELPSFSRFFPYCEMNEVIETHEEQLGAAGLTDEEVQKKLDNMTFETGLQSKHFDCRNKNMKLEDRERQVAAMRKRSRRCKTPLWKSKDKILDMNDKSLERIVATIADLCELEMTSGGRAIRSLSPKEVDNQIGADHISQSVKKTEETFEETDVSSTNPNPYNIVRTGETDNADKQNIENNEKHTEVDPSDPLHKEVEEEEVVATKPDNNVKTDKKEEAGKEEIRNNEKQTRFDSMPQSAQTYQHTPEIRTRDLSSKVRTGKINKAGSGRTKTTNDPAVILKATRPRMTVVELADILADINKDETDNETERHKDEKRKLRITRLQSQLNVEKDAAQVQANDGQASGSQELDRNGKNETEVVNVGCLSPYHKLPPILDKRRKTESKESQGKPVEKSEMKGPSKKAPIIKRKSPIIITYFGESYNGGKTQSPSDSDLPLPRPPRNKHRELSRMRYRRRVHATPITVSHDRKLSTRSYVMTEAGCKSQTMSYELMGLKRPENVHIYVRQYRTHRRSRNVKMLAVSPTTGTPYHAILPNYKENESPQSTPSPL